MTTWLARKAGSNGNGGTSAAVRSSGSDGIVNSTVGISIITSITAAWTAADIGHAIFVAGATRRIITAVTIQTTKTVTTSNGSTTVQSSAQFDTSMVGQAITGPGIPANTVVTVFTDSSHMTMNNAAGAGFGTGTATFYPSATTAAITGGGAFSAGANQTWVVGGPLLTVNHAVQLAATGAGDNLYLGAGVYRETVTLTQSGSAGLPISIIGDVDGAITGDAGEVQITNYLVNDKSASSATAPFGISTMAFVSFSNLTIVCGNSNGVTTSAGAANLTFTDCVILATTGVSVALTTPSNGTAMNVLIDRCVLASVVNNDTVSVTMTTTASGAGDYDANITIRNSFLFAPGHAGIRVLAGGASANRGGGVRAYACTIISDTNQNFAVGSNACSAVIPCEVHGSLLIGGNGTSLFANITGQLIESHNLIYAATARTNVPVGAGSVANAANSVIAPVLEFGQSLKNYGVARPWFGPGSASAPAAAWNAGVVPVGGVRSGNVRPGLPPGSPGWLHTLQPLAPVYQIANVPIPNVDWANRPRPAGTGSNLPCVGFTEFHDSAVKDTVTFDVSPASAKFIGPGDVDLPVPVDAVSQTISVRVYLGTNYSGPMPTVSLLANGEIGVAAQSVAATPGSWGAWQTVTLAAINPTAAGFVKVRLASLDSSGAGQCNFDTVAVA